MKETTLQFGFHTHEKVNIAPGHINWSKLKGVSQKCWEDMTNEEKQLAICEGRSIWHKPKV